MLIIHKNETDARIKGVAVKVDLRVKCKETEKREKYQPLRDEIIKVYGLREIGCLYGMTKLMEITMVTGVFGDL